jgi:hypothetical protein
MNENGQYGYGTKQTLLNKGYISAGIVGEYEYFCKLSSNEDGEVLYNFTNLQGDILRQFPSNFLLSDIDIFIKMRNALENR